MVGCLAGSNKFSANLASSSSSSSSSSSNHLSRFYSPYPVVELEYERREMAYLALGDYQSGSNASSSKFGFTQPMGRKVMQMMVGSHRGQQQQQQQGNSADMTSLPAPSDPAVRLSVAGGELVAVLPFEGYITPEAAAAARLRLLRALEADGLKLAEAEAGGMFRVAQYGAVHTLEARVNELMLAVAV
ncbi:regulatory factor, effector binding domain-containing protein [Scenedesmus sp. NREL 46B-D3]|nr:regulatory factor, effector binding domain-containing protein [Scenedesmus sp. NREL 46B-D3]